MRLDLVPLSDLRHWPRNPKRHDHDLLAESFERFGYVAPIIEDAGTGRLVAGHGRLDRLLEMKAAGEDPPRNVEVRKKDGEWLVPVLRGVEFSSPEEAEAYLLADNRVGERGGWGSDLARVLRDHANKLKGIGWSKDELTKVLTRANVPAPTGWKEFDDDVETNVCCPKCGYEWSDGTGVERGARPGDDRPTG